jgi:hypothetical protein
MANTRKTLNSKATEQRIEIAVTLPGYHTKGTDHGLIVLDARVKDGSIDVDLWVYGEGTQCPGLYRGTFSAADLGVSENRRTAEYMKGATDEAS